MTEIIVLRTHYYDAHVDRAMRDLQSASRRRIVAVVDERHGAVALPDDILKIRLDPAARGLFVTEDYGWRCGDYALYAAARAMPDASAYWMIEPDVRIHSQDAGVFFDGTDATRQADFVTGWFSSAAPKWQWYHTMEPFADTVHATMMQLCRLSRAATLALVRGRRSLCERFRAEGRLPETWPNDEAFVATTLAGSGFRIATFQDHAPDFKTKGSFTFTRPTSERWLEMQPPDNRIYHPVARGPRFHARLEAYLQEGKEAGTGDRAIDPGLLHQQMIESAAEDAAPHIASAP